MSDSLLTLINPHQATALPLPGSCALALFLGFLGSEVKCGSYALGFGTCNGLKVKQRTNCVLWKVFSSFFPLSRESHSLIKCGKA